MQFNSSQNYDSLRNYNGASNPVNIFYPVYDSFSILDSVSIERTKVVSVEEDVIFFTDSASVSHTDFSIGSSPQYGSSYDWFLPLPMKVDWANTSLQAMPTSESEYIDMPNVDGSMVQNTTYKNRAFNFVLYSNDGLSEGEKSDLKQKIVELLNRTKSGFKKLSISPSDHYFDVKYSGSASIQDGPSFVKATLPFEVKPYSHPIFPADGISSGVITNNGLKPCGLRVEISGMVSSPLYNVNGRTYGWRSSVPAQSKLIIDGEKMVCYLSSESGKTNGMASLYPEGKDGFVIIQPGESVTVEPNENAKGHITFSINESYIW